MSLSQRPRSADARGNLAARASWPWAFPVLVLSLALLTIVGPGAQSIAPIEYDLSFPEPQQRWMQVAVTVRGPDDQALEFRMSRSSPGRYSLHEFAKNVWAVTAEDAAGASVPLEHPNPHQWNVRPRGGAVTLRYRVYGDRVDGTYLAVDATHAHMNIPATLMYVRGQSDRPAQVTLQQPPGRTWTVATQLMPTRAPLVFTAPNLAYLMDSPIEFGEGTTSGFTVPSLDGGPPSTIRVTLHHLGQAGDRDDYLAGVERIVLEEQALMGELPRFEPGHYTFLADYLPWASGDGMEHRNSTVITASGDLASATRRLLGTVAHEFFHAWNVERIRPASLEPFDYADVNMSRELWLAEGFTSYAESLVMARTGLESQELALARWTGLVNAVTTSPAASLRSAPEMSELAAFTDAASAIDRTNWDNTFISYYTCGAALGLGMDLTLRAQTAPASFDGYMRSLWTSFGKPGMTGAPGTVSTPYVSADLRRVLASLTGSRESADAFFDRHVDGREPLDWVRLFAPAGIIVRKAAPGRPTLGAVSFDFSQQTGKVSAPTPFGSPAYLAGLAQDDELLKVGGRPIASAESLREALKTKRVGDGVELEFRRRDGQEVSSRAVLVEDPRIELVPIERAGGTLSPAHKAFRDAWLSSQVRR